MTSSMELFRRLHDELAQNYILANGELARSAIVARDLAERLLLEGRSPSVALFSLPDATFEPLQPTRYSGRETWQKHAVCLCDGLAYDPVLERPTPLDDYAFKMFGQKIPYKIKIKSGRPIYDFVFSLS